MNVDCGGSISLRFWQAADRAPLAVLANDARIAANLRDAFPHPYTVADAEAFIAKATSMDPQTFFAIEVEGALAGGIGYVLYDDVERVGAQVGYWLGAAFWGRGIATAAVRGLTRYAFGAHPELERLFAVPYATNAASARVLEKAGYRLEGVMRRSAIKSGVVLDQGLYAILRSEAAP